MNGGAIETFIYEQLTATQLPISGKVYYFGYRPIQNEVGKAKKEDIVIHILSGTADQVIKGSCVVNAYVPDIITSSGANLRDKSRCDELEAWLDTIPEYLTANGDIRFVKSGMILTFPEASMRQHFVSLKMDFKVLTD